MSKENTIVYSYNKDTKIYTINDKEMQKINRKLKERFTLKQENKQLKEEIKELEIIVGLRQKRNLIRKFDKEYNEEDKKKNPNRNYVGILPDAEEVYRRYYKQKDAIDEVREDIIFCINGMKNEYPYTDSRTNRELHTMVKILEDRLQILDKVKGE